MVIRVGEDVGGKVMKIYNVDVDAATYKRYNANARGKNAPDCVKRAISMAFNLDYNEVSKLLLAKAKEKHKSAWNILTVYEPVIYDLGGSIGQMLEEPYTVERFIDEVVPNSICIMETSPKVSDAQYGRGNHLTCSVNGTLYDSWDSSHQYVCQYYLVEGVRHDFTDIQDHLDELIPEGSDLISQLAAKYEEKYNLPGQLTQLGDGRSKDFEIRFMMKYEDDVVSRRFSIDCVFSPTTSLEAARKKMTETIKVRMYDRFYEIAKMREQKAEGDELFYASGYTDKDKRELYLDTREERFFNSLPGWFKPFVTYLNVSEPGQFSDSYQLSALPIKGDPRFPETVTFYGYSAEDVRDEIARYKKNFERVDEDYSYYEEY